MNQKLGKFNTVDTIDPYANAIMGAKLLKELSRIGYKIDEMVDAGETDTEEFRALLRLHADLEATYNESQEWTNSVQTRCEITESQK